MPMSAMAKRSDRLGGNDVGSSKRAPWWTCGLFLLVLAAPVAAGASEPTLVVSPQIRAEVGTELDFHVRVDSTNAVPADCSIIITGLPKSVTFSAGSAIATGVWEVPLLALDRLKMVVPTNEASSSVLIIFLAAKKKDLVILASARSFLFIEAPTEDARRQVAAKQAEDERLAEAKRAEEARAAELAKAAEDARRQAAAKKAEEERLAEAKKAEVTRVVEQAEAATEVARRHVAAKMAEDERLAEAKRAEARAAELAKAAEDARRQVAAKMAEDERLAEAKRAEARGGRTGEGRRGRTPRGCGQEGGGRAPSRSPEGRGDKGHRRGEGRGRAPGGNREGRGGKGTRTSEGPGRTAASRCCKGRRVYANGRGSVRGTGSCRKSAKNAGFGATRKAGRARGPLPRPRQHPRCPAVLPSRRPGWACRCRFQTRRNTRPARACAPERPRFET